MAGRVDAIIDRVTVLAVPGPATCRRRRPRTGRADPPTDQRAFAGSAPGRELKGAFTVITAQRMAERLGARVPSADGTWNGDAFNRNERTVPTRDRFFTCVHPLRSWDGHPFLNKSANRAQRARQDRRQRPRSGWPREQSHPRKVKEPVLSRYTPAPRAEADGRFPTSTSPNTLPARPVRFPGSRGSIGFPSGVPQSPSPARVTP